MLNTFLHSVDANELLLHTKDSIQTKVITFQKLTANFKNVSGMPDPVISSFNGL